MYESFFMRPAGQRPLRMLSLLLGAILLLWQLCLVYHQAGHGLNEQDEVCLLCQAADHMSHGIAVAGLPAVSPAPFVSAAFTHSTLFSQSPRSPSARSPPAGFRG